METGARWRLICRRLLLVAEQRRGGQSQTDQNQQADDTGAQTRVALLIHRLTGAPLNSTSMVYLRGWIVNAGVGIRGMLSSSWAVIG